MNRCGRTLIGPEPTPPYVILHGGIIGDGLMARIVIVEDEIQVLMLAESVLQQAGHNTVSAATVAEAQAIINSKEEKFDLMFTDVQLGAHEEGGITVGKMVGQIRKGTPVLYTSGRMLTDGMQSLFAEPSAFLPKPYTAEELTEAVSNLLRKRPAEGEA
jgi:two-component system cell cycle sensor histidine kinase/response regulator CckA